MMRRMSELNVGTFLPNVSATCPPTRFPKNIANIWIDAIVEGTHDSLHDIDHWNL